MSSPHSLPHDVTFSFVEHISDLDVPYGIATSILDNEAITDIMVREVKIAGIGGGF